MLKILIIGIGFYEYEKEIAKHISNIGHSCLIKQSSPPFFNFPIIHRLILNNSFLRTKLLNIHHFFLKKFIYRNSFNKILVINANDFQNNFFEEISNKSHKTQIILYLWDSISRLSLDIEKLNFFTKIFSFDRIDCNQHPNLNFRPLFFIDSLIFNHNVSHKKKYDFCIISVLNDKRLSIVKKILEVKKFSNIKIYLYGGLIDVLKNRFSKNKNIIFMKSISLRSYYKFLSDTKCLIDIGHENQSGLSMRCIESIGCQTKLFSSNKDLEDYDIFSNGNISIDESINDETIDIAKLENALTSNYTPYSNMITEYYSLSNWVNEVMDL